MLLRPNVGQRQGATKTTTDGWGLWSNDIQRAAMERAGSCHKRQLYVCKSSVTYSVTGRSPTQIAPSLRHSHRNASAICCVQSSKHRGEPGNPHSLHRLKPASTSRVPEEGTTRGGPGSSATSPDHMKHGSCRDTLALPGASKQSTVCKPQAEPQAQCCFPKLSSRISKSQTYPLPCITVKISGYNRLETSFPNRIYY